jgi:hypothetical protein
MKYKTKPCTIEAVQWTGENEQEVLAFCPDIQGPWEDRCKTGEAKPYLFFRIHTLEGNMEVDMGDFIIKGLKGEFYPCKPEIFVLKYEPAE